MLSNRTIAQAILRHETERLFTAQKQLAEVRKHPSSLATDWMCHMREGVVLTALEFVWYAQQLVEHETVQEQCLYWLEKRMDYMAR